MHAFWVVLCKARLRLFEKSLYTQARAHANRKAQIHTSHMHARQHARIRIRTRRVSAIVSVNTHKATDTHIEARLSCTHAEIGHSERDGHRAWWVVCTESVPRKASSQTVLLLLFALFAMGPLHKKQFYFFRSRDDGNAECAALLPEGPSLHIRANGGGSTRAVKNARAHTHKRTCACLPVLAHALPHPFHARMRDDAAGGIQGDYI